MSTHSVMSHVRSSGGRLFAIALLLMSAGALPVGAQQSGTRNVIRSETPDQPDYVRKPQGIRLFGNADLAGTGMKMTKEFGWGLSNLGPCADGFVLFECGDVFANGGFQFHIFEINITAGTPPHEFRKIRTAHPDIQANVSGGGYTQLLNFALFSGRAEVGPADGTLGALFSGAPSTDDGSCRDNTSPLNGYMTTGVSLLAGSTCPDTWAGGVFDGPRPIPDSAFIRAYQAAPDSFNFDWFRIPENELDQNSFLGDFSTYGAISDSYTEILGSYGGVTRLGSGPAAIGGYPLGLAMDFQAYSFGLPQIANVVFWQMTVVNNSERLYGTGIDYDSLYMGLELGWGNQQANAVYYVPSQNAVKVSTTGTSGTNNCNGGQAPAGVSPCSTFGFSDGAVGVVGLKSPIGDMRNKFFTTSGSPFYNPANVHAGDTITFNHGHMCGFGSCWNHTLNANDRRGFGMISSTSENVLDGRTPGSLTATQNWRTFRNFDFPATTGKFNYYVPGNWDYNHDGSPDTLFYDTCHVSGCVTTWADTMPGKQIVRYSNVGGVMTAGPFALGAGDTTSFVWAFLGAPDSASFESVVRNAIDAYMGFFLTPKPPPVPPVTTIELEPSVIDGAPSIRLTWGSEPEDYLDEFLDKFAAAVESDPAFARIAMLNPWLADSIRARADQNFKTLYIFKSCDDGNTFTNDADCVGDEARDPTGNPIGLGWQPYTTFHADEDGNIPNALTDANVIGGRTYLYSLVTQARGFTIPIVDSTDSDGDGVNDAVGGAVFTASDSILSALQRSGPSTAKVYVPISLAAGATPATVNFTVVTGFSDVPVSARFTQAVTGGTYRMVFGNRFVVITELDSATNAHQQTRVVLEDVVTAQRGDDPTTLPNFPLRSDTLVSTEPVQIAGSSTVLSDVYNASVRIITEEVTDLGFVLLNPAGVPLFVSTDLTPAGTTPSSFSQRADFPGFTLVVDQGVGGDQTFERIIKTSGDTVVLGVMNSASVQVQENATDLPEDATGTYNIEFAADAFGAGAPFVIDFGNVQGSRDAITASINARTTATTGVTDQAIADLLGVDDLVPVRFPFTITNETFDRQTILAMSASDKQSSILLGAGADTLRLTVSDSVWVPGDAFYVLEIVQVDSTQNGQVVLDANDQPIQVTDTIVSFGTLQLGCNSPRVSCNPLQPTTRGGTGYLPYQAGWVLRTTFATPFSVTSDVELEVRPLEVASTLDAEDLDNVLVVPNPFVFQSQFDEIGNGRRGEARVLFTNVPARGTLRVFSVSGQFLQQLSWTEVDLDGTGDLPYNLRTREGTDLASGLYIFVITAENGSGGKQYARGKFVVIR